MNMVSERYTIIQERLQNINDYLNSNKSEGYSKITLEAPKCNMLLDYFQVYYGAESFGSVGVGSISTKYPASIAIAAPSMNMITLHDTINKQKKPWQGTVSTYSFDNAGNTEKVETKFKFKATGKPYVFSVVSTGVNRTIYYLNCLEINWETAGNPTITGMAPKGKKTGKIVVAVKAKGATKT